MEGREGDSRERGREEGNSMEGREGGRVTREKEMTRGKK